MIEGFVNEFSEPIVELDIKSNIGGSKKIEVIVDTGFNGYISLPNEFIEEYKWEFLGTEEYELANGEITIEKVYLWEIIFDGEKMLVFGLANRSYDTLIRTKLLKDRILTVDFKEDKVLIE